jgi:hypothetical protein
MRFVFSLRTHRNVYFLALFAGLMFASQYFKPWTGMGQDAEGVGSYRIFVQVATQCGVQVHSPKSQSFS